MPGKGVCNKMGSPVEIDLCSRFIVEMDSDGKSTYYLAETAVKLNSKIAKSLKSGINA